MAFVKDNEKNTEYKITKDGKDAYYGYTEYQQRLAAERYKTYLQQMARYLYSKYKYDIKGFDIDDYIEDLLRQTDDSDTSLDAYNIPDEIRAQINSVVLDELTRLSGGGQSIQTGEMLDGYGNIADSELAAYIYGQWQLHPLDPNDATFDSTKQYLFDLGARRNKVDADTGNFYESMSAAYDKLYGEGGVADKYYKPLDYTNTTKANTGQAKPQDILTQYLSSISPELAQVWNNVKIEGYTPQEAAQVAPKSYGANNNPLTYVSNTSELPQDVLNAQMEYENEPSRESKIQTAADRAAALKKRIEELDALFPGVQSDYDAAQKALDDYMASYNTLISTPTPADVDHSEFEGIQGYNPGGKRPLEDDPTYQQLLADLNQFKTRLDDYTGKRNSLETEQGTYSNLTYGFRDTDPLSKYLGTLGVKNRQKYYSSSPESRGHYSSRYAPKTSWAIW